jgi:hypothetical protein
MPDLRTEITEIVTGLGMTGIGALPDALAARPAVIRNVEPHHWDRLDRALEGGRHGSEFDTAFINGRTFLESPDGLRGRQPQLIEWKGSHQPPGFDFLPVDLRIDHVFLVSCKYQSKVLMNSSPTNLFQRRLSDRLAGSDSGSWYTSCAPDEYQHLYSCIRRYVGQQLLPPAVEALEANHVARIRTACSHTWPAPLAPIWAEFSLAVAVQSADRWRHQLQTPLRREEMLWRLLRLNPSTYFLLGSSDTGPIRLRIGTPWDLRQHFTMQGLDLAAVPAGQPKVSWTAHLTGNHTGDHHRVEGHVEVRWAHGRFSSVEAKIYLDTPHGEVPGYVALASPL